MNFPASSKGKSKKARGGVKQITRIASLDKKKARAGWLFVLPFILGFAIIYIPIIWQSISFSFSEIVSYFVVKVSSILIVPLYVL